MEKNCHHKRIHMVVWGTEFPEWKL